MGTSDPTDHTGGTAESRAAAGRTHVGRIREHNEDDFLVRAPLFVVADGMGGHLAGEVASAHAIAELRGAFDAGHITGGPDLVRALCDAHEVIATDARRTPSRRGMGTTCVAVLVEGEVAHVAHIGDSRAYLLRGGRLERLTEDHSLVAELVRDGVLREDEAERDPRRHIVLRALGADDAPQPDLREIGLLPGDRLLLCSDGLSGVVPEAEIATLLAVGTPGEAADRLVARTLNLGAPDNVTVIVVDAGAANGTAVTDRAGAVTGGSPRRRRTLRAGIAGAAIVVAAGAVALTTLGSPPTQAPSALPAPTAGPTPSPTVTAQAPSTSPAPSVPSPSPTPSPGVSAAPPAVQPTAPP